MKFFPSCTRLINREAGRAFAFPEKEEPGMKKRIGLLVLAASLIGSMSDGAGRKVDGHSSDADACRLGGGI